MLPLFDLHCDTLSSAYERGYSLFNPYLQASLSKSSSLSPYIQVMAIWTNKALNNKKGFERYLQIMEYAREQKITFAKSSLESSRSNFILAIEDARIIEDDISRLNLLYDDGVRIITPVWKGINVLGGAWDTSVGLTSLGKSAISKMLDLGITIDLSHASERTFYDILLLCTDRGHIPMASHSNSFHVCPHRRNLNDAQIFDLIRLGSVIGISLAPEHLSTSKSANITDILRHIEHYLKLGAQDNLCLGCDFDGVDSTPDGIRDISELSSLYSELNFCFGEHISRKIFFDNAYSFATKNLF